MYADDLLLISITFRDLRNMLDIVCAELSWLHMVLNVKKSSLMRIGPQFNGDFSPVSVYRITLPLVEISQLGVDISSGRSLRLCMHTRHMKLFRAFNMLYGKLGGVALDIVIMHLTRTFCLPIYCCMVSNRLLCLNLTSMLLSFAGTEQYLRYLTLAIVTTLTMCCTVLGFCHCLIKLTLENFVFITRNLQQLQFAALTVFHAIHGTHQLLLASVWLIFVWLSTVLSIFPQMPFILVQYGQSLLQSCNFSYVFHVMFSFLFLQQL